MIKVLIVDDSAVVRKVLSAELSKASDIEVVGTAIDPFVARDKIIKLKPDVVTLDMELPRMNGLTFLEKLMKHFPLPVIVISSMTPAGSDLAVRALGLGAVEVIAKPGSAHSVADLSELLIEKVRVAAKTHIGHRPATPKKQSPIEFNGGEVFQTSHKLIALVASTGGTRAIEDILKNLPANTPGIVIAQHLSEHFTAAFAERLNEICQVNVREAKTNDLVLPGVSLIAPGNKHMILRKNADHYYVVLKDGPQVNHQRPSVDVLFHSVARHAGQNAVGVILTGMGRDGAEGMLALKEAGAHTIAQDEASSVIFGMPKEAIKLGGVKEVVAISDVPQRILNAVSKNEIVTA